MNSISSFGNLGINLGGLNLGGLNSEAVKTFAFSVMQETKNIATYALSNIDLGATALAIVAPIASYRLWESKAIQNAIQNMPSPTKMLPNWSWTAMNMTTLPGNVLFGLATALPYLLTKLEVISKKNLDAISENIVIPIIEEFEWRWFVQHICLPAALNLLLNTVAPGYSSAVNHLSVKVAGVIVTAGLFALQHTSHWGQGNRSHQGIASHFVNGLIYGALAEYSGSIVYSSIAHCTHNFFGDYHAYQEKRRKETAIDESKKEQLAYNQMIEFLNSQAHD